MPDVRAVLGFTWVSTEGRILPLGHGHRGKEKPQIPALVLGSSITALGAVRSLGRAGIPLHLVSPAPAFVRASRWYRPPPHGRLLADSPELPGYLESLPLERAVLIPTSDHAALACAGLPPALAARFPASQAPPDVLASLIDKQEFGLLLDRYGVPRPVTLPVAGVDDDRLIPDAELGRFIVKPRDSQAFSERFGVKAFWPSSREELRDRLRTALAEGFQVVLQAYIPGPPTNHYFLDGFYDRHGVCLGQVARRRLRMSPPDFGNSCATVSIPPEEAAEPSALLARLLAGIGYRGPYDAEFKRDAETGRYHLIELNVRAWWQAEFAARCGVDAVTMCYRDALGLPQQSVQGYQVGREWLMPSNDLAAWRHLVKQGEMDFAAGREFLRSWTRSYWAGFAWDDPLPGAAVGADLLRLAAGRMTRRAGNPGKRGYAPKA